LENVFASQGNHRLKLLAMATDRVSAGLLMYRFKDGELQAFLAHPGGPYFKKKDEGHWTIPKGEIHAGENLLATAIREFQEETGIQPAGEFIELGSIRQKGGKLVHGWAFQGNWDESIPITSNTCKLEWPPLSGKFLSFPEIDRAQFFSIRRAREKIKPTQQPFLDRLVGVIKKRHTAGVRT
jgi:predicted NUDIX family NTP pyrophosphohydrolase